jgi:hypothetical protein
VRPFLIVLGMLGFALRGGIVVLTVPIVMLPTQVEARLALGSNLDSTGLTGGFVGLIAAATVLTLAIVLGALYGLARAEVAAFAPFAPTRLTALARRSLTTRLFIVQALTLLAILTAAVPLAAAVGQAAFTEIVRPSSADSIYPRILGHLTAPLALLIAAVIGVELISASAARVVVFRAHVISGVHLRPLRSLAVSIIGWALSIGAVVISVGALSLAWDGVRSVFLSTGLSGGLPNVVAGLLVAALFAAVYVAALVLCGFVSALRASFWTLASLR